MLSTILKVRDVVNLITEERLAIYTKHLKVSKGEQLAAYHWNKSLAGALLPAIQCLEVTLRNAIVNSVGTNPPAAAKGIYSTGSDWIFSFTTYMGKKKLKPNVRYTKNVRRGQSFDTQGYALDNNGERLIVQRLWEEKKVFEASKRIRNSGRQVTSGRVISAMDFGFWTNFLSVEYEDSQSKMLLWPNLLNDVFPNAPQGVTRCDIEIEFNKIRELRNRLTHHEAIWKFFYDNPVSNKPDYNQPVYGAKASCSLLLKHYEDILKLIGWMSTERLSGFQKSQNDSRFRSFCCIDGLNSFINPEKLTNSFPINKGGWGLGKVISLVSKGEVCRITRLGKTTLVVGKDFNRCV